MIILFQFQTGAIRSYLKVSIRFYMFLHVLYCFNSKLVRLEDTPYLDSSGKVTMFQFQTGAIRRKMVVSIGIVKIACFNSKLVRLEGKTRIKIDT